MIIVEKECYAILKKFDGLEEIFGIKYVVNPFEGCSQGCIYCENRSRGKYEEELTVYLNSDETLRKELFSDYKDGVIGIGSFTEIYQPACEKFGIVEKILNTLYRHKLPVHIFTKSNRILKDRDILKEIAKTYCAVTFSISTTDEEIASVVEPNSPSPIKRFEAMRMLKQIGIISGIIIMPVLPYLSDKAYDIEDIVRKAKAYNADYVIYSPALILKPNYKDYFINILKSKYPDIAKLYLDLYNENIIPPDKYTSVVNTQIEIFLQHYELSSNILQYKKNYDNDTQIDMFGKLHMGDTNNDK